MTAVKLAFDAALLFALAFAGLWYRNRLRADVEDREREAYVEALTTAPSTGRHHSAGTGTWRAAHTAAGRAAEGRHTLTSLRIPAAYLMDHTGEHRAADLIGASA